MKSFSIAIALSFALAGCAANHPAQDDSLLPGTLGMAVNGSAEGVVVAAIRRDGPAARAGVKVGDVITQYNGVRVTDAVQLRRLMLDTKPGSVATVMLVRQGRSEQARVTVEQIDIAPRA
jgi:putative serine protease PepD